MSGDSSRLDASIQGMKANYSRFSISGSPIGTGPVAVWKGVVQPIQSSANLEELLDDIYNDRPVEVLAEGRVQHFAKCGAVHNDHDWMEEITDPCISYKLELRYGGDSVHPRAFVLNPPLPSSTKHTLGDGLICPYAPWEKVWSWKEHTVVDFMDHVLIWLIKATIWIQARIWIGDEWPHDTEYLFSTIEPAAQCWCGSGEQYQNCHRPSDNVKRFSGLAAILEMYNKRNPYFIETPRVRLSRRLRKAALSHQPKTRFNSRSHLAKESRPNV